MRSYKILSFPFFRDYTRLGSRQVGGTRKGMTKPFFLYINNFHLMRESLPDSCHILPQWIETTVTFNNLIFSLLSCVVVLSFSDSFLPSNKAVGTITSNQSLSLPPSLLFSSRVCPSTIAWSLSQHSTPYYKEINNNKLREREKETKLQAQSAFREEKQGSPTPLSIRAKDKNETRHRDL